MTLVGRSVVGLREDDVVADSATKWTYRVHGVHRSAGRSTILILPEMPSEAYMVLELEEAGFRSGAVSASELAAEGSTLERVIVHRTVEMDRTSEDGSTYVTEAEVSFCPSSNENCGTCVAACANDLDCPESLPVCRNLMECPWHDLKCGYCDHRKCEDHEECAWNEVCDEAQKFCVER